MVRRSPTLRPDSRGMLLTLHRRRHRFVAANGAIDSADRVGTQFYDAVREAVTVVFASAQIALHQHVRALGRLGIVGELADGCRAGSCNGRLDHQRLTYEVT